MTTLLRSTFALPIIIATISLAGLVSGLLGAGLVDILCVAALSIPVLVIGVSLNRSTRK